jgi:hypothetical protein
MILLTRGEQFENLQDQTFSSSEITLELYLCLIRSLSKIINQFISPNSTENPKKLENSLKNGKSLIKFQRHKFALLLYNLPQAPNILKPYQPNPHN